MKLKSIFICKFILLTVVMGCSPGEDSFLSKDGGSLSISGSIVVANTNSKNVVLLDANGVWVRDLLALDRTGIDVPVGVGVFNGKHILVSVDGVDRVTKVDLDMPNSVSEFILNGNLTGATLRGVTQLAMGDILVVEQNNVERFLPSRERVATGGWPKALQNLGSEISAFRDSGFVHCSTTSDVVRTYDNDGVQIATAASGITATTDVTSCAAGPNGEVAAAFNGTTDTIRVYSSRTLATTTFSYSNLGVLANPRAMAFRPNGNLLVADGTNNIIVELSPTGTLVRTISSSAVNNPISMVVVP